MGITSILNVARNALFAQQTSLQVISNNIANVNTAGYARQEAVQNEAAAVRSDLGLLGTGVKVEAVISHYDKYLEYSMAKQNNAMEEQKTYQKYFSRIESILDEANTNLTSNITEFFNAWQSLSADPLSRVARNDVAMKAENLSRGIRSVYNELINLQIEADYNVAQDVDEINNILGSIAELNKKIVEGSASGTQGGSFTNERLVAVRELSGKLDIQYFEDSEGALTVMTKSGKSLVEKGNVYELSAEKSETDDFYRIYWNGNSQISVDITDSISGGTLKGLIDLRDNQMTGFMDNLDDLAKSIMTEVNSIHATGYNSSGTTGVNFFKNVTSDYAINLDLSDEVKADVNYIAATSSSTNLSDNDIALAISNLGSATVQVGGHNTTYVVYASTIASTIGNLSKNATDLTEYHQDLMNIVESQREAVSGVSIDEEMSNLIKFQYAYQAAARLITVADELMDALLRI